MTLPTPRELRDMLTTRRLRQVREDAELATHGRWGAWGTSLLVDPTGGANADTADRIADFYTTDGRGRPQTFNLDHAVNMQPLNAIAMVDEILELRDAVLDLVQAIRLTREYVGPEVLPALDGWEWYEALRKHAPSTLTGVPSGVDEADESRAQFIEHMRHHGDPDGIAAGAYDVVQQARGIPPVRTISHLVLLSRADLEDHPSARAQIEAEQGRIIGMSGGDGPPHCVQPPQRRNDDGTWEDAEPLGMIGWKAKLEERFRHYGWTRLSNFMARWDERGLGK